MSAEDDLVAERLTLATKASRLGGRRIAVLAIEVHERRAASDPPPAELELLSEEATRRIRACLAKVDTVSRAGPLRYLVLLERAEEGSFAVHAADQILLAIRTRPFRAQGRERAFVASVGVSAFPEDGDRTEVLLDRALQAMTGARLGGGDLVGFCSGSTEGQRRLAVERALVGVLERGELTLAWQPQIDTREGALVGAEALLRWTHPRLGVVSPLEMIPILEASGRIHEVGGWVLREACKRGAEWARVGSPLRVGVNVSAHQLGAEGFERDVDRALADSGLPPSLLELELTESVLVADPASTRERLERLRARGARIAVDDFGTGYASLAYIRRFPMDTLKIDREFVTGLPTDHEAVAITSAIIMLAQSLDLELVAEGVENEAEEEFLHSQRCFVVQGFRHARPMSDADFDVWRASRPWL